MTSASFSGALRGCTPPPPDYERKLAEVAPCAAQADGFVDVLGAVSHPGRVPLAEGPTLTKALTAAGGLTALSYRGRVRVRRCRTLLLVDVEAITDFGATDPKMTSGDEIFVTTRED